MHFHFTSSYFLLLFIIMPLLVYYRRRKRFYPEIGISSSWGLAGVNKSWAVKAALILPVLKYASLSLLIIAIARPQWGTRNVNISASGINIILAVDVSESMAALDFKKNGKIVNRLEAVKGVVNDFISKRTGDRIGMVVFGSEAYTQIPLTLDYNSISTIIERLNIGAAGKTTAIGDAIGISLKRITDIESKTNIIILLTDGRSNSGELSPEIATNIAAQKKVKIYTIGVGSKGKVPFLIKHPLWGEQYVYQQVDMDEEALKEIASKTGGLFFKAEDINKLEQIYDKIDKLEKTQRKVKIYEEYKDLYYYFLLLSFLLLSVWMILSNTRFLRIP